MARSCCSSCCFLSLKVTGLFAAFLVVFVKVINPALDYVCDKLDPIDDLQPVVAEEAKQPFDPLVTDILGYKNMQFSERTGKQKELYMGLTYILTQSSPRWMVKLAEWWDPFKAGDKVLSEEHYEGDVPKEIDILDARKHAGTFDERGFTLIDMKDAPSIRGVKNWRIDVKAFQDDLEPRLLDLYPKATRIEFLSSVIRGGSMFGDQPAAIDGPHLDYTQNDTARQEFHEEYPTNFLMLEANALLGNKNSTREEMKVLLGIWKPVMMETPVCDNPLAVMDARTFKEDQETPFRFHINFGVFKFNNLNGAIHHHEDQKWYYYPFQKESEVLVFTQYSRGKHFANPHGSFVNTNCPEDSDKRVSVEMRAAIFFPNYD